jgi:hypothetical protein
MSVFYKFLPYILVLRMGSFCSCTEIKSFCTIPVSIPEFVPVPVPVPVIVSIVASVAILPVPVPVPVSMCPYC